MLTYGFVEVQPFFIFFSRIFWYNKIVNVDIENLSLEQLIELHNKVCKRIKELNRTKLSEKLQSFEVGERVGLKHEGNTVTGTVIRINQKSLTVKTKEGSFYVHPVAVSKISLAQMPEQ